ncbi:MAG: glycosyltransferase family 4 protein, partial [Nitrospirota bacterium]|nr:glycosyltransferase family 4 protein [Nitrospirota bacterium]
MRLLRPIIKSLYRIIFSLNRAKMRVIFQNTEDRAFFVQNGLVPELLTQVIRGSGVDCKQFSPTPADGLPAKGPVKILFASRMLREKGIFELAHAARLLKEKGLNFSVILAGDVYPGNPSSLTAEEITEICSDSALQYVGHRDDIKPLLTECDIVVLPSYREGTPRILIEAAAMEKPIVATKIAGCMGLVEDNVNGFLVPVGDAASLAAALEKLVRNKELRESMGKAGREIVLAGFSEEIVLQKTFAVYRDLLPQSTPLSSKG